jgi:hypothetical protein
MSGIRTIISPGYPATDVDMQRLADTAASSEDRVYNLLFTPQSIGSGLYDKAVFPLLREPQNPSLTAYQRGRSLVYGDPLATAGTVNILPFTVLIGDKAAPSDNPTSILLSASLAPDPSAPLTTFPASAFPTSVGHGYIATVYALVQRIATTGARKFKDPTTGNVSTQVVTLYTSATVTVGVALGLADGSFTPPTLPADSSTAWYVPLANIKLDDGAGGAWTSGAVIAQTRITQTWPAGWIRRNRVQLAEPASIMSSSYSAGVNGRASTPLSSRWGASISVTAVLQHVSAAPGVFTILDGLHDWHRRTVWISGVSIFSGGPSDGVPPDQASPAPYGMDTGAANGGAYGPALNFCGAGPARQQIASWNVGTVGSPSLLNLYMETSGILTVEFNGAPRIFAGHGYYLVTIEGTDTFQF